MITLWLIMAKSSTRQHCSETHLWKSRQDNLYSTTQSFKGHFHWKQRIWSVQEYLHFTFLKKTLPRHRIYQQWQSAVSKCQKSLKVSNFKTLKPTAASQSSKVGTKSFTSSESHQPLIVRLALDDHWSEPVSLFLGSWGHLGTPPLVSPQEKCHTAVQPYK